MDQDTIKNIISIFLPVLPPDWKAVIMIADYENSENGKLDFQIQRNIPKDANPLPTEKGQKAITDAIAKVNAILVSEKNKVVAGREPWNKVRLTLTKTSPTSADFKVDFVPVKKPVLPNKEESNGGDGSEIVVSPDALWNEIPSANGDGDELEVKSDDTENQNVSHKEEDDEVSFVDGPEEYYIP